MCVKPCSHVTSTFEFASNVKNGVHGKKLRCSQLIVAFSRTAQQRSKTNKNADITCEWTFSSFDDIENFPWKRILLHFSMHLTFIFFRNILPQCFLSYGNVPMIRHWMLQNMTNGKSWESGDTHFWKPWIFLWRRVGGDTSWRRWRGSRWSAIFRADGLCTLAPKKH